MAGTSAIRSLVTHSGPEHLQHESHVGVRYAEKADVGALGEHASSGGLGNVRFLCVAHADVRFMLQMLRAGMGQNSPFRPGWCHDSPTFTTGKPVDNVMRGTS